MLKTDIPKEPNAKNMYTETMCKKQILYIKCIFYYGLDYNRNGWGFGGVEEYRREGRYLEEDIIGRERDIQRQGEDSRIAKARYNRRYGTLLKAKGGPIYLRKENLDNLNLGRGIRAMIKLRCENMEEIKKYWMEENAWKFVFCGKANDWMTHYVEECERTRDWFEELGK